MTLSVGCFSYTHECSMRSPLNRHRFPGCSRVSFQGIFKIDAVDFLYLSKRNSVVRCGQRWKMASCDKLKQTHLFCMFQPSLNKLHILFYSFHSFKYSMKINFQRFTSLRWIIHHSGQSLPIQSTHFNVTPLSCLSCFRKVVLLSSVPCSQYNSINLNTHQFIIT